MEILLKNVSKEYSVMDTTLPVLDHITLKIGPGSRMTIVGDSGSGKTTLLRIFALLDKLYQGNIYINGKNVRAFSEVELARIRNQNIGYVFQSYGLLHTASVKDNILYPTYYSSEKASVFEKRMKEIVELMGIEKLLSRQVRQLSGGEKQRTAFARALIMDPDALFLDEPFHGFERERRIRILEWLEQTRPSEKSIVLVTHDPEIATSYGYQKFLLSDRKLTKLD